MKQDAPRAFDIVSPRASDIVAGMDRRFALGAFAAIALSFGCAPAQRVSGAEFAHANPVIDADFPDPAVIRAPDGFYYAYATQTERDGRWVNLQMARSRDHYRVMRLRAAAIVA